MKDTEMVVWAVAGLGLLSILYVIKQQTNAEVVPETQSATGVMGYGLQASMRYNPGTPLEISPEHHGWHPGFDPDPHAVPVTQSKHRYPAVPGGNLSTIMHQGWSACVKNSPDNDWRITPPEAAVL